MICGILNVMKRVFEFGIGEGCPLMVAEIARFCAFGTSSFSVR